MRVCVCVSVCLPPGYSHENDQSNKVYCFYTGILPNVVIKNRKLSYRGTVNFGLPISYKYNQSNRLPFKLFITRFCKVSVSAEQF